MGGYILTLVGRGSSCRSHRAGLGGQVGRCNGDSQVREAASSDSICKVLLFSPSRGNSTIKQVRKDLQREEVRFVLCGWPGRVGMEVASESESVCV